ncbi:hypothetical protein Tco_0993604 [Tanacetum coccineum]
MTSTAAQQVALDNALVGPENRVQIGKCNMRIDPIKTPKEPTYQVVLDSLVLFTLYPAFLITAEVPEIYMHQFWHTITKIKNSSSYKFKLDKKKCTIDVEVFRDILQICPRLPNQEFDAPPSDEEIVTFIKELGHKVDIKSVTEVVVDQMHQPWRTFATIISRRLSRKTSGLDKIRLSRAQILWGAATPKKARKFKKPSSLSKKKALVAVEKKFKKPASPLKKKDLVAAKEPGEKPMKKPAARRQSAGVQIRDTPGMSVSKKKAPTMAERSKGIELLSEATSLEEAQLKRAIKRSKRETNIHQPSGSSEGADLESEVCDELKGKSIDTSKGTGLKPGVPDLSRADSFKSEYESWGDSDDDDDQQSGDESTEFDDDKSADLNKTDDEVEDEFIHTPDNYVPTDDENVDDKEYEVYDDVNVELKDTELADEEKGDEEMSHAKRVDVEHEEVSQAVAGDEVNDDAHAIVMVALATQKTEVPLQRSSISSDYATKFLNFDNIPPCETKIISMMDIKVEHEDLSIQTSPLLTVPVMYIGTNMDDTVHKVIQWHTAKLIKEHSIPADVVEYSIKSSDKAAALKEFDQKRTLLETMTKTKSFNKNAKHMALYHALMESILEDEDAMDKGVAEKSKKRNPDDANRDEGPHAGSNQGLKRKKTSKETEPSKKAKSTGTSKGTTKSQLKSTGKSAQAKETVFEDGDTQADLKDWFKKPKRPPTLDPEWNKGKTVDNKPTQKWFSDLAKAETSSKTFDDLMSTLIDFSAFVMNRLQITLTDQLDWNNPEGESTGRTYTTSLTKTKAAKYDLLGIEDMNRLFNLKGEDIVHLVVALHMFTRRIVIQKRVEDLQLGVESYQKKLNISKPRIREEDLSRRAPYTTLSDPQGVIYEDKLNKKRLMHSDELYKCSDGTL